jgi:hypothetical protein
VIILQGADKRMDLVRFAPDSRRLVAATNASVEVWEEITPGGRPSHSLEYANSSFVRFTPDGQKVIFLAPTPQPPRTRRPWPRQYVVGFYDLRTQQTETLLYEGAYVGGSCNCTPDGSFVVLVISVMTWGTSFADRQWQTTISCRAMADLQVPLWTLAATREVIGSPLFLADGNRFVLVERASRLHPMVRETATGRTVGESRHPEEAADPVLSADGRWIARCERNQVVVLHGENFAAEPIVLKKDNPKQITGLAFHPSGRYLAATSNDATVTLFDTETWKLAKVFTWEIGRVRSVAFSPDGMLAAAGGDKGRVIVWDFDL